MSESISHAARALHDLGGAVDSPPADPNFEAFLRDAGDGEGDLNLRDWLDRAAAWRIRQALRAAGGNRAAAARKLGIGRRTLYTRMEKLGI